MKKVSGKFNRMSIDRKEYYNQDAYTTISVKERENVIGRKR